LGGGQVGRRKGLKFFGFSRESRARRKNPPTQHLLRHGPRDERGEKSHGKNGGGDPFVVVGARVPQKKKDRFP